MKIKMSRIRLLIISGFTLVCIIMGCMIAASVKDAGRYSFDLGLFASELEENGSLVIDSAREYEQDYYHSTRFSLRNGSYTISVRYEADSDYNLEISSDNDNNCTLPMPAGSGTATCTMSLEWPTDRAYINFEIPDDNRVIISDISIESTGLMYTDGIFQLLILLAIYAIFIFHAVRFDKYDKEKKLAVIIIPTLIILLNLPLYINPAGDASGSWPVFDPINPMTRFGIDTRGHLLRLEAVVYGLLDGQFPVVIAPNLLNECGELSFLNPDFFLYPFAVIRLLGASMLFAYRILSVSVNICTVLAMYYACRQITDRRKTALVLTAVYVFEPHRLRVILEKGAAVGMGLPYVFLPLCVAGIYLILKKKRKGVFLLAFGVTGIIESHITTLVLLMIFLAVLLVVFIKELTADKMSRAVLTVCSALLAAVMNMGMIVIFLYYYISGVNTAALVWDSWEEYLLGLTGLASDTESLFYLISIPIAVFLAIIYRKKTVEYKLGLTMIVFSAILFWMTSRLFPWHLINNYPLINAFTNYMQKPHRFYTIMASLLVMGVLLIIKDATPDRRVCIAILTISGILLVYGTLVKYSDYFSEGPLLYDQILGNMNTRQIYNYLPVGVDKDMEFSGTASLSDWDNVESLYYKKRGTHADYSYISYAEGVYAEFPLLMYNGYVAVDEAGNRMDIESGDCGRVRIGLKGDGMQHEVHVAFKVKRVFAGVYVVSLIAAVIAAVCFVRKYDKTSADI